MEKVIALLILVLAVSLCTTQPQLPSGGGITTQGFLQFKITDAVGNVSSLVLNINKIEVHKASLEETQSEVPVNQSIEGNETNETETSNWITVLSTSKTVDLISVKDLYEFLGETVLDSGRYTQVRITVASATAMINGTTVGLTIPSNTIKFVHTFVIEPNKTASLVFDFDAARSLVQANNKTIFKPVVKILTEFKGQSREQAENVRQNQKNQPQPPTGAAILKSFTIEADDMGFYPANSITVNKDDNVQITFQVRPAGVYYGGLDFKAPPYFVTQRVAPGNSISVNFTADKNFTFSSYWPASGVKKADGQVVVI